MEERLCSEGFHSFTPVGRQPPTPGRARNSHLNPPSRQSARITIRVRWQLTRYVPQDIYHEHLSMRPPHDHMTSCADENTMYTLAWLLDMSDCYQNLVRQGLHICRLTFRLTSWSLPAHLPALGLWLIPLRLPLLGERSHHRRHHCRVPEAKEITA